MTHSASCPPCVVAFQHACDMQTFELCSHCCLQVVHRDMKLENILLSKPLCLLSLNMPFVQRKLKCAYGDVTTGLSHCWLQGMSTAHSVLCCQTLAYILWCRSPACIPLAQTPLCKSAAVTEALVLQHSSCNASRCILLHQTHRAALQSPVLTGCTSSELQKTAV